MTVGQHRRWWWKEYTSKIYFNLSPWFFPQLYPGHSGFWPMRKPNTLCVTAERFSICVSYLYVYSVKLILTLIHTYNLYSQILAEGLPTKEHFFYLNMTKTVHAQYMYFNRLARLWNKLPQHIRMSDSLSIDLEIYEFKLIQRTVGCFV